MTTFHERAAALLDSSKDTDTVIVAIVDANNRMVIHHSHSGRPRDLVDIASSLLDQALDIIHQDAMIADNHDLMMQVAEAIDALPDRFEEPD